MQDYLAKGGILKFTERNLSFSQEDEVIEKCSKLAHWIQKAKPGEEKVLKCQNNRNVFLFHKEIRSRFKNVWTYPEKTAEILVKMVTLEQRARLEINPEEDLSKKMLEDLVGFSRVIKAVIVSKKPIVGHNCLTDLLKIYNQFVAELPESYIDFKQSLHKCFPTIFDTKEISFRIRKYFEGQENEEITKSRRDDLTLTHWYIPS